MFKIFKSIDKIDYTHYITLITTPTRANKFKINKVRSDTNIGQYWFFNRVVNIWNSLPDSVVTSETLELYKKRLDMYMKGKELDYFNY